MLSLRSALAWPGPGRGGRVLPASDGADETNEDEREKKMKTILISMLMMGAVQAGENPASPLVRGAVSALSGENKID